MPRLFSRLAVVLAASACDGPPAASTEPAAPVLPRAAARTSELAPDNPAPPAGQHDVDALRERAKQALTARDFTSAAPLLHEACEAADLGSCVRLAELLDRGIGVAEDGARARELFARACAGGLQQACDRLGH